MEHQKTKGAEKVTVIYIIVAGGGEWGWESQIRNSKSKNNNRQDKLKFLCMPRIKYNINLLYNYNEILKKEANMEKPTREKYFQMNFETDGESCGYKPI